ncbi:MAG: EscU/YscU/HrcU family type III secretion system export apparatus switch protein [Acidaminococcales bacterium]|jgi:flagellar biosynthesis protein|nr:EscU/YscU/HrcU family type III secretion system export apparatus switch protein [Acidaminococcales bacterium]
MAEEKKEITQAVALSYDTEKDSAPKVVAKGRGVTAENILKTAKNSFVPVYQNKALTQMLMALELDSEIPPELYQAVAEVLSYVYRVDKLLELNRRLGNEL